MRSSVFKGQRDTAPQAPRVIAITSGKGGVGKTHIAVNLAISLSSLGKRVVIFDADLGLANVEVLLGLKPRHTIHDFLYKGMSLSEIITPGPNGVGVISGGSGLLEMANLSQEAIKSLQDSVSSFDFEADVVLVDTGAGINKNVLAFVAAAQEVIVVVTPEPTSITDAYGLIKILDRYKVHSEVKVLVNQSTKQREADITYNKIQSTAEHFLSNIRIEYLGSIPEDEVVVKSAKSQQAFVISHPNSEASIAIKSMAIKSIASKLIGKADTDLNKKEGGLSGFFSRLTRLFR